MNRKHLHQHKKAVPLLTLKEGGRLKTVPSQSRTFVSWRVATIQMIKMILVEISVAQNGSVSPVGVINTHLPHTTLMVLLMLALKWKVPS